MATWSTLKADQSQITDLNDDVITVDGDGDLTKPTALSGTAATEIYLDRAKEEMKQDLIFAQGLDPNESDDMTTLDNIVDYNETFLKKTLAYKQLCLFYSRFNEGEMSLNWDRKNDYCKYYSANATLFGKLKDGSGYVDNIRSAKIRL